MADPHPLDRPVWNALVSRQAELARGDGPALRFDPDYGFFAAAVDASPASLAALAALAPVGGEVAMVEADPWPSVPGVASVPHAVAQMICRGLTPSTLSDLEIEALTEADAPQMRELAALTKPGPFFSRTHRLGAFIGVKEGGRLVAMAGERMRPTGFTEVSGVCTHPDHRGRGLAGTLMRVVAGRILERGETAFLHAYASNTGAIGLYQSLGFTHRHEMTMTVLTRG
jgi:predicted GNAT family acetyltransferase